MDTTTMDRDQFLANLRPCNIADLPTNLAEDLTCGICFGDLADNAKEGESERAILLHGTHHFGEDCIKNWLAENGSCPSCRHKLYCGDAQTTVLLSQADNLVQRVPTLESPISDHEVLALVLELIHASWDATAANEPALHERYHDAMVRASSMRMDWFATEAGWLRTDAVERYIPRVLSHAMDTMVDVDSATLQRVVERMSYADVLDNFVLEPMPGQAMHIATHPLATVLFHTVVIQLGKMHGTRVAVQELSDQLHEAVETHFVLGQLGRYENVVAQSFKTYCRDMVRVICRAAIVAEALEDEDEEEFVVDLDDMQ